PRRFSPPSSSIALRMLLYLPQSSGRRHTMARARAGSSAQEAAALGALVRLLPSQSSRKQQSGRRRRYVCPVASYAYGTHLVLFYPRRRRKEVPIPVKVFDLTDGILYHARNQSRKRN